MHLYQLHSHSKYCRPTTGNNKCCYFVQYVNYRKFPHPYSNEFSFSVKVIDVESLDFPLQTICLFDTEHFDNHVISLDISMIIQQGDHSDVSFMFFHKEEGEGRVCGILLFVTLLCLTCVIHDVRKVTIQFII